MVAEQLRQSDLLAVLVEDVVLRDDAARGQLAPQRGHRLGLAA